ncbi:MAG: hypothetical protein GF411_02270 [Candidatus Lokiarchaeota archaeon]|nr:hypothetical protein [Candidatus Lokiarchaeota archaeon]
MSNVVSLKDMVSRSLEKMMLVAVGLTTAVLVGVPVLLYAMNTVNNATQIETAQVFAEQVHDIVNSTDCGITNDTLVEIEVPSGVSISASGSTLTITFQHDMIQTITWVETYTSTIILIPPESAGAYNLNVVKVNDGELLVKFIALS